MSEATLRWLAEGRRTSVWGWSALALASFLVVWGQLLLVDGGARGVAIVCWVAGLALFVGIDRWTAPVDPDAPRTAPSVETSLGWARWTLVGAAAGAVAVWFLAHGRSESADYDDVAVVWVLSIAAAVVAALPVRRGRRKPAFLGRAWIAAGIVVGLAFVLRVVELERFPSIIDHDGTSLAMIAVAVQDGTLQNPFTTGWLDHPTLFAYFQAASMWVFGDSLQGVRMLSALFGAGAVLFTWLYMRRLFPEWVALLAALFLAVFHFHLHFSRVALNNVADSFFLMTLLYLLDRGFVERRRLDCLLAGLVLGISQFFYFGSRLLVPLAVAVATFLILRGAREDGVPHVLARRAGLAAWFAGGAVLAFLPLFAHYVDQPEDYNSRADVVSVVGSGWLAEQRAATGRSTLEVVGRQVEDAVLIPFATPPHGNYRPAAPLLGLPMAVLAAIGIAIATARLGERRYFAIAVAWWGAIAGVGLTQEVTTPRFVIAAPLVAFACALAVWCVERQLRILTARRRTVAAVLAAGVLGVAVWNVQFFFRDSNRLNVYGDVNSLVATRLAYEVRDRGPGTVVYFAGPPRMSYAGFSGLAFVAREAQGIDLVRPLRSRSDVPLAGPRTLFVFLPERRQELLVVRSRYPAGRTREVGSFDGEPLYTVFEAN